MAIPYRTAKFKSANTFVMANWDPTAKFNSRQYFWLYGIMEQTHPIKIIIISKTLFSTKTNTPFSQWCSTLGAGTPMHKNFELS